MKGFNERGNLFCHTLLCAVLALLSLTVEARKTFLVKMQHPTILAPKVSGYDTSWKIINVGNKYELVLDNQIQMETGFDWVQKQGYYKDKSFR